MCAVEVYSSELWHNMSITFSVIYHHHQPSLYIHTHLLIDYHKRSMHIVIVHTVAEREEKCKKLLI